MPCRNALLGWYKIALPLYYFTNQGAEFFVARIDTLFGILEECSTPSCQSVPLELGEFLNKFVQAMLAVMVVMLAVTKMRTVGGGDEWIRWRC